jgi:HK97 gp10 family phage protein
MMAEFNGKASNVQRQASQAVRSTLEGITADGKVMSPVDTGNLKASISWEMTGDLVGETGPEASYGIYLETGTSRMPPQPYMNPAADRWEPRFREALDGVAGFGPMPRGR